MLLGGALRGRSPRTREGRLGPTAQEIQERAATYLAIDWICGLDMA